jgi:hypothetical protein
MFLARNEVVILAGLDQERIPGLRGISFSVDLQPALTLQKAK